MVEQMCSIAAIRSVPASSKTLILKFLAMHAYFAVDKSAVGKVWACLLLHLAESNISTNRQRIHRNR